MAYDLVAFIPPVGRKVKPRKMKSELRARLRYLTKGVISCEFPISLLTKGNMSMPVVKGITEFCLSKG